MNNQLNKTLDLLLNNLSAQIQNFPWENRNTYACWLAQTYYFARHTTRLLSLAASKMPLDAQDLHNRFIIHAREEKGHELILLSDLKALNIGNISWPEFHPTALLYQSQYYIIDHENPMIFFGYILGLEALADRFGKLTCEKLENYHGKNATNFIRLHAIEDQKHTKEAIEKINLLPKELSALVATNLERTLLFYSQLLQDCQNPKVASFLPAA